jgi:hypothetical protein
MPLPYNRQGDMSMPEQEDKIQERKERTGGIESKLDGVAVFYLVLSILALIVCLVMSQDEVIKKIGFSSFLIAIGIGATVQGIVFWILFRADAEVVRLLKKLNGLPYAGSISETVGETASYVCTDCGAQVSVIDKVCTQCGSKL